MFQSTRPHGARLPRLSQGLIPCGVSIHAPARGATRYRSKCLFLRRCFNPRARTGRDRNHTHKSAGLLLVSIHAPARGATYARLDGADFNGVSIHAPARGATIPTLPNYTELTVSIHAPARGATLGIIRYLILFPRFNPRARTGRDSVKWNGL